MALAGGIAAASLVVLNGSAGRSRAPAANSGGIVVSAGADDLLQLSSPAGRDVSTVSSVGVLYGLAMPSLDNRLVSTGNGTVIALRDGRPVLVNTTAGVDQYAETAIPEPFADHDRYLVVVQLNQSGPAPNSISVASLATGRPAWQGNVDNVAGDPQGPGVFASLPGRHALAANPVLPSDSRLVLTDTRPHATVLATAAELNRRLGAPPGRPVSLAPYPDLAGGKIAVTVAPVTGSRNAGIVLLSRSGRVLGTVPAARGVASGAALSWSASGASVAYPTKNAGGYRLSVWTPGRAPAARPLPAGGSYSTCIWSPDGRSIVCAASNVPTAWTVGGATAGRFVRVNGPGLPIAWLPGITGH